MFDRPINFFITDFIHHQAESFPVSHATNALNQMARQQEVGNALLDSILVSAISAYELALEHRCL